jgi:hypothetical protein
MLALKSSKPRVGLAWSHHPPNGLAETRRPTMQLCSLLRERHDNVAEQGCERIEQRSVTIVPCSDAIVRRSDATVRRSDARVHCPEAMAERSDRIVSCSETTVQRYQALERSTKGGRESFYPRISAD